MTRNPNMLRAVRALVAALCIVAGVGGALGQPDPVYPERVTWEELRTERFDLRWRLPDRRSPDLRKALQRVLARSFPAWRAAPDRPPATTVGDLIAEFGRLRTRPSERRALWRRFARERAPTFRAIRRFVPGLLQDDALRRDDWDPDDDVNDDGVLAGRTYSLAGATTEPWRSLGGSRDVHQAAVLIWADLGAIKEAENDYARYPEHPGSTYEFIHAVPGSYVRGTAPDGKPFSALRIRFRNDLPFPYSTYDCDLEILNTLDADDHLVTDIYSTSPDFYWMAGQDVFLPVRRSDGTWVAMLLVRVFGFDLRNVPDGSDARETALRASLGNLKRKSERLFARRRPAQPTVAGTVSNAPLRGVKDERR